jgi:WD40 repeat protein
MKNIFPCVYIKTTMNKFSQTQFKSFAFFLYVTPLAIISFFNLAQANSHSGTDVGSNKLSIIKTADLFLNKKLTPNTCELIFTVKTTVSSALSGPSGLSEPSSTSRDDLENQNRESLQPIQTHIVNDLVSLTLEIYTASESGHRDLAMQLRGELKKMITEAKRLGIELSSYQTLLNQAYSNRIELQERIRDPHIKPIEHNWPWSETRQIKTGVHGAWILRLSPDGSQLVTFSKEAYAHVWDIQTGNVLFALEGHKRKINAAAYSSDGLRIATGSKDSTVKIWNATNGKLISTLSSHAGSVDSVAFSPNGQLIATSSDDTTIRIWDSNSGKLLKTIEDTGMVNSNVQFSPDGLTLLSAAWAKPVRLWEVKTGALIRALEGTDDWVHLASFSPDGKHIVTASKVGKVQIWDTNSGILLRNLIGHSDHVSSARFSPNGKQILTASYDKSARLWDLDSGDLIATLPNKLAPIGFSDFYPDGSQIFLSSQNHYSDPTIRIWQPIDPNSH